LKGSVRELGVEGAGSENLAKVEEYGQNNQRFLYISVNVG